MPSKDGEMPKVRKVFVTLLWASEGSKKAVAVSMRCWRIVMERACLIGAWVKNMGKFFEPSLKPLQELNVLL